MKIAVAGATGRLGRHVVDLLQSGGHEVVAISRSKGVDLLDLDSLTRALAGVECVIDASSEASPDQKAAMAFFVASAQNLHAAGQRAGVRRIIEVSIIGADRFTAGYMAAKGTHERAMLAGPIPVRLLRAAQFHELVAPIVEWGRKGDVSYVPKMVIQPVAARTAAQALVDLAVERDWAEATPIPEIAGPQREDLDDLAERLVIRRGDKLRIEGVVNPADPDLAQYESGALLPGPHAKLAGPTFDEWLAAEYPARVSEPGLESSPGA